MWWVGKPRADLYLGMRTVAVCRDGELALHERVSPGVDPLDIAGDWIARQPQRGACSVWLSGALARPMLLPGQAALQSAAERQRVGQALAMREFGWKDADVWVDGACAADLAIAVRAGYAREVEQRFAGSRLKLSGIRPLWAAVLNSRLEHSPACAVLGVADGESLTGLGGAGPTFTLAESIVPSPAKEAIAGAVQRAVLRAGGVPGVRQLVVLNLDARAATPLAGPFGPWMSEGSP